MCGAKVVGKFECKRSMYEIGKLLGKMAMINHTDYCWGEESDPTSCDCGAYSHNVAVQMILDELESIVNPTDEQIEMMRRAREHEKSIMFLIAEENV